MPDELPKAYEPGATESRWPAYWKNEKLFHASTPPETAYAQPCSTTVCLELFET